MAKAQNVEKQKHNMNSPEQLEAIKAAIIAGESPRSIHEKYGTSIVNVHYHKAQLRKQGLIGAKTKKSTEKKEAAPKATKTTKVTKVTKAVATPTKAVKAPKATKAPKVAKKVVVKATPVVKEKKVATTPTPTKVASPNGPLSFVIGSTKVSIDKSAKSVKVGKKSVLIEF